MVGNVFGRVASNYDLMNDLMSGGLHRLWKDRLVSMLNPFPGIKHLDVAGGTGDVAFRILDGINSIKHRANQDPLNDRLQEETQMYVCDINPNMLNVGRKQAIERVIPALGELVAGDRESYQYLVESIRSFPPQEKFASMMADAGFQKVEYENLVGGVVAIHSGLKI